MQDAFFDLADHANKQIRGSEQLLLNFASEASDFVRFNQSKVRQAGSVDQAVLGLSLIDGRRHDQIELSLCGRAAVDRNEVDRVIAALRDGLAALPDDPYLLYSREALHRVTRRAGVAPTPAELIDTVIGAGHRSSNGVADLVGFYAGGPIYRGFASSLGARCWHEVNAWQFDWSIFQADDRAVKRAYAAMAWQPSELTTRIEQACLQLEWLARPVKTIPAGDYRVYLAPAAVDELLGMLNWDGVSLRAQRAKQSPLAQLINGEARFAPGIHLNEDFAEGLAPQFDAMGFARPARVALIESGQHVGALACARSAQEFGVASTGAPDSEAMLAMTLAGGALATKDALTALDTGIYVSNLWYLNFSDRQSCRITGMTRFATFWVERGRIVAPLAVMRFDDSLFRTLGSELEALTVDTEWMLDPSTYGSRSTRTARVPGALVRAMRFTL